MSKPFLAIQDRFKGAMVGLAVGDALGAAVEFKQPGTFKPLKDMVAGGPHRLEAGQWTDDTSMALCLAQSLLECGAFNPTDQMERYVRWWQEGYLSSTGECFDIGGTVVTALRRFIETRAPFAGSIARGSAGNGSLMRLAPVPLFYHYEAGEALERAEQSSRTTHGAQASVDACRYFAGVMWGALAEEPKDVILSPSYCPISGYFEAKPLCPEIAEVAAGSFKVKQPPQIVGSGYVVRSLEAALWAFHQTDNFQDGCLLAANLGQDADTTAAIFGQLAGAFYGVEAIPETWRSRLAQREFIEDVGNKLFLMAWNRQFERPQASKEPTDAVLYVGMPAETLIRRQLRDIVDGRAEVVRLAMNVLRADDKRREDYRAFLLGEAETFPPFDAPEVGRDWDSGLRFLNDQGEAIRPTFENLVTHEDIKRLERLNDFAQLNRPFDWSSDPRMPHWQEWVVELDKGRFDEPVVGPAQELWDLMFSVARADRFNDGLFYGHATAMTRLANELRRRLLGGASRLV